jgi:hypothetical protein
MTDIYPPDYTDPTGQVRLLIPDTDYPVGGSFIFSDDQITGYLALAQGSVKRAAAAAIDTLANDEALLYKTVRTDDLSVDGTRVADALRKRAQSLRDEADQEDVLGAFTVVWGDDDCGCRPEATPWPSGCGRC